MTPEQQAAVDAAEGAYLLNAPPGAGKTEVLVQRIERLLRDSAGSSFRVLALTHTTRAAEAISRRITDGVAEEDWRLSAETIHAFARQMLHSYGQPVGVQPDSSILATTEERLAVLADAFAREGLDVTDIEQDQVRALLERLDELRTVTASDDGAAAVSIGPLTDDEWLKAYDAVMDEWRSIDFPGLLWRLLTLLEIDPWTRRHLARMHRYVLLDEAQDCTPTQLAIVNRLVGDPPNLFVVASESQSIYAFGGADPARVLGEIRTRYHPTELSLSSNFRSAERIVAYANNLAQHLPEDIRALMTPVGTATGSVEGVEVATQSEEVHAIAEWIVFLLEHGLDPAALEPNENPEVQPKHVAVLARTKWDLEPLRDRLIKDGHHVTVRVSEQDAVISDRGRAVHAALRSLVNPSNPTSKRELRGIAEERSSSLPDAEDTIGSLLARAVGDPSLAAVTKGVDSGGATLTGLMDVLLALPGSQGGQAHETWTEERAELERCWTAYKTRTLEGDRTLAGFMRELSRLREASLEQPGVRLLTLHAAKGAEFKAVAVMGLNEGSIPHYRSLTDDDQVNDERQAFYVAITRPSRALLVTRSRTNVTRYGTVKPQAPSRFLEEMGLSLGRVDR